MDLFQNPFHVLKVTPFDMLERVIEASEELSLFSDPEACHSASLALQNLRKRLTAEVGWFVQSNFDAQQDVLKVLEREPEKLLHAVNSFTPSEQFNILVTAIGKFSSVPENLTEWIIKIARLYESIEPETLLDVINENRLVSGFPQSDALTIVESLEERRSWCRSAMRSILDQLPSLDLVRNVTKIVDDTTENGQTYAPRIIDDIVNFYEVEAQSFFNKEVENVKKLVELIRVTAEERASDSLLTTYVDILIKVMKNWDMVAQPIQVNDRSRGVLHKPSRDMAYMVRGLSVELFNKYGKLQLVLKINEALREVFAEVVSVAELIQEDESTLRGIEMQRREMQRRSK